MTASWVCRAGSVTSVFLLVAGLIGLQFAIGGWSLFSHLAVYPLIALAAFVALLARRGSTGADFLCLASSALFFGYVILRAVYSPVPYAARADLYSGLAALTVYGLVISALTSAATRLAVLVPLLALAAVHVVISLFQSGIGENLSLLFPSLVTVRQSSRGSGLFVNPNHLAGFLHVIGIFGLSVTCWARWPRWAKVLVGYLTGACYLALALTGSRGGYLSAAVSVLVFSLLSLLVLRAAGARVLFKAGSIGLFLIAGTTFGLWQLISEDPRLSARVSKITAGQEARFGLWDAALEQWKLQPVTGTGSGTYRFFGRQFRAEQMQADPVHAHNDYLELLAEYGIIGAAGFLLFLVVHLHRGWRTFAMLGIRRAAVGAPILSTRLALTIGGLSALAAYGLHSAVEFNLHIPANAALLALVFGILANPDLNLKGEENAQWRSLLPKIASALLATALLIQCVRLLPGEYYADKARAALWDEEPSRAIEFAEKALQHEQQNPHVFFHLGRAKAAAVTEETPPAERKAAYEEALAAFERAHRVAPLDGMYLLDLGFTLGQLGRFAEAEEMYQLAMARDPRSRSVAQSYRYHRYLWRNSGEQDYPGDTHASGDDSN